MGGGYALAFGHAGRDAMGASGFWIAATVGMITGSSLITLYFLKTSRTFERENAPEPESNDNPALGIPKEG